MKQASTPLSLSDGTRIMPGDPVGELHLWNDHVPHFPSGGPTLGWARRAHALMVHSLSLLADHVATQPEWQGVQAFYADVPISPKRSPASVRRVSRRYGFEPALRRRTVWRSVHDVIESLLLGGLAYAYNPAASHRQSFCGTGSGYGSVARRSFGCMAPEADRNPDGNGFCAAGGAIGHLIGDALVSTSATRGQTSAPSLRIVSSIISASGAKGRAMIESTPALASATACSATSSTVPANVRALTCRSVINGNRGQIRCHTSTVG